jgi:hypothetical protein
VNDITISGGTKGTFLMISGSQYTLVVYTLNNENYTGTVQVAAGVATDGAGNGNTASNEVSIYVDRKAPIITSVTPSPTSPTSGGVTLTVNAEDSGVGLHAYSFDNGTTRTGNNHETFIANTTGILQVQDSLGNISSTGYEISNIDKDAPQVVLNGNATMRVLQYGGYIEL